MTSEGWRDCCNVSSCRIWPAEIVAPACHIADFGSRNNGPNWVAATRRGDRTPRRAAAVGPYVTHAVPAFARMRHRSGIARGARGRAVKAFASGHRGSYITRDLLT